MSYVGAIPENLIINGIPLCHSDRKDDRGKYLTPCTRQYDWRHHEVLFPFAIRVDHLVQIALPQYILDGFSVPRPAWWFQSPFTGPGLPATFDHDPAYWCRWFDESLGRREARAFWDERFRRIMLHYGETERRANIMHRAVRIGAGRAWTRRTDEQIQENRNSGKVKIFCTSQTEEILTTLARYQVIGQLLIESRQHPAKAKMLNHDMTSIAAGNIDELLLHNYINHKSHEDIYQ